MIRVPLAVRMTPALAALSLFGHTHATPASPTPDPFAFLWPAITVSAGDRARLHRGEVVVHVLPGRDGEVGVFAATRLDAPADALVVWTRAIADLKKSPYVLAIRRFSDPPVLEDLDGLTLDEGDVEAIRRCKTGDCDVKLAAHEIQTLREAAAPGAGSTAVQQAFRRVVFQRVESYRAGGLAGLSPYADRETLTYPQDTLGTILGGSPGFLSSLDGIGPRLREYPQFELAGAESFFYWSKEQYGAGKHLVTVTHVDIVRPEVPDAPSVLVLGKEIFATHYRNGSLGMTAVVRDSASGTGYLVYVNRSHVDVLSGVFGGLKRLLIEGRLKSESADLVRTVRSRLEGGAP